MTSVVSDIDPSNGSKLSIRETLLALAVMAPFIYFATQHYAHLAENEHARQILERQIGEVAAHAATATNLRLDELPASSVSGSTVVKAVVNKLGLRQIAPKSLRDMFADTTPVLAPVLGRERMAMTLQPDEPVPGLFWKDDVLRNAWNGAVSVYRKDQFVMVAYTNVPREMCDELRLGLLHISGPYLFACNDTILSAQNGNAQHVDISGDFTNSAPGKS